MIIGQTNVSHVDVQMQQILSSDDDVKQPAKRTCWSGDVIGKPYESSNSTNYRVFEASTRSRRTLTSPVMITGSLIVATRSMTSDMLSKNADETASDP